MVKREEIIDDVKREYSNLDGQWTSLTAHKIRSEMLITLDFIKKVYPGMTSMDEIIEKYYQDNFVKNDYEGLMFGYTYALDQIQNHLKNPNGIWKVYDSSEDKSKFFREPVLRYTINKVKNHEMFARDIICGFASNHKLSESQLNAMPVEKREKLFNEYDKVVRKYGVSVWENLYKERYIKGIKKTITILEKLGVLEDERNRHNEYMGKIGLEALQLEEQIPSIDDNGYVFGCDLEKCSVFQLEAILSFYSNRLEKHRENLGIGLFMLKEFKEQKVKNISAEQLKAAWKKYRILDFMVNNLIQLQCEEYQKKENDEIQVPSIVDQKGAVYVEAYESLFDVQNGMGDVDLYKMTNGANKQNQYLIKGRLMEDLILQSVRENANWGIMAENDGSIKIKKLVCIGIDIPGFNMPLRLHYPLEDLRKLMRGYVGEDEMPLYIGADDFVINGDNFGTQLLLPITPKQSATVKKLAKRKEEKPSEVSKLVKHIACVQLPNMVKKLLDEKTGKKQQYPDYINIFTRRVRRTQRRGGALPEDSGFSH